MSGSDSSEAKKRASVSIDQSGQSVKNQVNIAGDARIDHVGDKISGEVVVSGQVAGDVHVTYLQRAPIPPPPPPLRPPRTDLFVGRDAEIATYTGTLAQAGIAVISGMAGMGKTTLAAELARRLAPPEKIFWHSFHEGEGVETVVWRLAGFLAANGAGDVWAMLQNAAMNQSRPPPPELLFDYLVEQSRGQGFLLCLDDFQFLTDSSLLNQLVDRIRPLLLSGELKLIITSREVPAFVQLVSFDPLGGLSAGDLGELLAASDLFLEETQMAQLHRYTGGNAQLLTLAIDLLLSGYAAAELLEQLVETDDVEDFLMDEVESRLTRNERLVMSAVAILQGHPGSRAAIEAVLDGRRARRALRDLSDRFLLTVSRTEGQRLYNQHAIVRDFFYEALNRRERNRMHLRAAEFYRDEEQEFMLAIRQFMLGGSQHEAVSLATDNVYLLLTQGHATALDHALSQVQRHLLDVNQRIAMLITSGQVNDFLGENEQAEQNFTAALGELDALPASTALTGYRALACLGMAELLDAQAPRDSIAWAERGLALDDIDPLLRCRLLVIRGNSLWQVGEFDEAEQSLEAAMLLLPEEPTILRARILNNRAAISVYRGAFDDGKAYAAEALSISRRLNDPFEAAGILQNYAVLDYVSGDWPESIVMMREALAIVRELGNRSYAVDIQLNLGKALIYVGDHDEAYQQLQEVLALAQETGNELSFMMSHISLAELQCYMEAWVAADANLRTAEKLLDRLDAQTEAPFLYSTWTDVMIARQQLGDAQRYAAQAVAAAEALDDPYEMAIAARAGAKVAGAAGEYARAEALLGESIEVLREFDPFQHAQSELVLGALLLETGGRTGEALARLEAARDLFAALGAGPDLQRAEGAIARINDEFQGSKL